LTVTLLRGEAGPEYAGIENVHKIACFGRIETCDELENGDYDIVILGLRRVRIIRETQRFPYPAAEIEAAPDFDHGDYLDALIDRHSSISGLFARFMELATNGNRDIENIMPQMDFELLVNTIAMALNISAEQKQDLLEMDNSFQRCKVLITILQRHIETLDIINRFEHLKPVHPHFN